MQIIKHPNKILRQPTEEVNFPLSEQNKIIIKNMINLMYQENGIGLAANQVGHSMKIFVMDVSNARNNPQVLLILLLKQKTI